MLSWLRQKTDDLFGRGGCWAKTRREHLEREPACAACGRTKDLQVHHIVPYHVDRARECDPTNLLTVCADPCHFVFCHYMSWQRINPNAREDCRRYREGLTRHAAEHPAPEPQA